VADAATTVVFYVVATEQVLDHLHSHVETPAMAMTVSTIVTVVRATSLHCCSSRLLKDAAACNYCFAVACNYCFTVTIIHYYFDRYFDGELHSVWAK